MAFLSSMKGNRIEKAERYVISFENAADKNGLARKLLYHYATSAMALRGI